MKFYSEVLDKLFDSENELLEAEIASKIESEEKAKKEQEEKEEKEKRTKELEELRANMIQARRTYEKAVSAYVEKYGAYHFSTATKKIPTLFDIFDL